MCSSFILCMSSATFTIMKNSRIWNKISHNKHTILFIAQWTIYGAKTNMYPYPGYRFFGRLEGNIRLVFHMVRCHCARAIILYSNDRFTSCFFNRHSLANKRVRYASTSAAVDRTRSIISFFCLRSWRDLYSGSSKTGRSLCSRGN